MKLGQLEEYVLNQIGSENVTLTRLVTIRTNLYRKRRGVTHGYPGESLSRFGFYKRAQRMIEKGLMEPAGMVNNRGADLFRRSLVPLAELLKQKAPPTPPKKKPAWRSACDGRP